ncbi:MAG: hypothetical protein OFPI_01740 [Osedax symbiont Rs2]|nr:MAG: hypothetical protein OFPI_01740 [Osedax symbiont Rs2]
MFFLPKLNYSPINTMMHHHFKLDAFIANFRNHSALTKKTC